MDARNDARLHDRRWLRRDWERWLRPDWENYVQPAYREAMRREIAERKAASEGWRCAREWLRDEQIVREREEALAARRAWEAECAERKMRADIAWERFRVVWAQFLAQKAGFNRNQPRVPAGNSDGGRWTSGGESGQPKGSDEVSASRRLGSRPHGHHYLTHAFYSKLPLPKETRAVFDEGKTGRLHGQVHRGGREHDAYNEAVKNLFWRYVDEKGITVETMQPHHAHEVLQRIKTSTEPTIRDYNIKILRRELHFWIRGFKGRE